MTLASPSGMRPPDARAGVLRWRCTRDPLHGGDAIVPPEGPLGPPPRWGCPYCAAPVVLAPPAPADRCVICGTTADLRREQGPSGGFEAYCGAHDPLPRPTDRSM